MIRLGCFDMAGTTVCDEGVVISAFDAAIEAAGLDAEDREDARRIAAETMGRSEIEVFRQIFSERPAMVGPANRAFEEAFRASIRRGKLHPIDGVEDFLVDLKRRSVKLCLVTGFSPGIRDAIIKALGWQRLIDLAVSPVDAGRGRPFPDMILYSVIKLEVEDVRYVAVAGDNPDDLLAGYRAGAGIVAGVLTGNSDSARLAAGPHTHIVSDLTALAPLMIH